MKYWRPHLWVATNLVLSEYTECKDQVQIPILPSVCSCNTRFVAIRRCDQQYFRFFLLGKNFKIFRLFTEVIAKKLKTLVFITTFFWDLDTGYFYPRNIWLTSNFYIIFSHVPEELNKTHYTIIISIRVSIY